MFLLTEFCVATDERRQVLFFEQQSTHRHELLAAAQRRGQPYTSIRPLPRGIREVDGVSPGDAIRGPEYGLEGQYDLALGNPRGEVVDGEVPVPMTRVAETGYGAPLSALNNVRPFRTGPAIEARLHLFHMAHGVDFT